MTKPPSDPPAPPGRRGGPRFADRYSDRFERERSQQAIKDLVDRVVDHYRLHADLRQARLFAEWPAFVGEKVGNRTRPDTIVGRTLIVEVATSAWLQELRLLRPKIVADLLDKLGMPRFFDDIKFVLAGERKRREPVTAPRPRRVPPPSAPPVEATPATGQRLLDIIDETKTIEDDDLRSLVARVRILNDK